MKAAGILIVFLYLTTAHAQKKDSVEKPSRIGFSAGPLMPKGVSGVREIVPLSVFRYSCSSPFGYVEAESSIGNANGNFYSIVSGRLVYDFELGLSNGLFFIGGDIHHFKTVRKIRTIYINGSTGETSEEVTFEPGNFRTFNGWHLGFGFTADITKKILLRGDTFIRYSPGQTGFVGLGIEILLDSDSKGT